SLSRLPPSAQFLFIVVLPAIAAGRPSFPSLLSDLLSLPLILVLRIDSLDGSAARVCSLSTPMVAAGCWFVVEIRLGNPTHSIVR
ncbi:hypothetical protein LINPERPRIM_LOCUS38337, partial [Linum perenne]